MHACRERLSLNTGWCSKRAPSQSFLGALCTTGQFLFLRSIIFHIIVKYIKRYHNNIISKISKTRLLQRILQTKKCAWLKRLNHLNHFNQSSSYSFCHSVIRLSTQCEDIKVSPRAPKWVSRVTSRLVSLIFIAYALKRFSLASSRCFC